MQKRNRKTLILLGLYFIVICSIYIYSLHARATVMVGKLTQVEGTVDALREGALPAVSVKAGDPVFVKDVIRTKSQSKAEITFSDGNILIISQRSRIDISEYFTEETRSRGIIRLQRGKVEAKILDKNVRRISISPKANLFEIHTPCAVAGVRGTKYHTYQNGPYTTIYVEEGTVYVYNPKFPDQIIEVHAGEAVTIFEDGPPPQPFIPTEDQLRMFELGATSESASYLFDFIISPFPPYSAFPGGFRFPGSGMPETMTRTPTLTTQPPVSEIYPNILEVAPSPNRIITTNPPIER
jgi:hypothetical protein